MVTDDLQLLRKKGEKVCECGTKKLFEISPNLEIAFVTRIICHLSPAAINL
jgi:hypothetical protein